MDQICSRLLLASLIFGLALANSVLIDKEDDTYRAPPGRALSDMLERKTDSFAHPSLSAIANRLGAQPRQISSPRSGLTTREEAFSSSWDNEIQLALPLTFAGIIGIIIIVWAVSRRKKNRAKLNPYSGSRPQPPTGFYPTPAPGTSELPAPVVFELPAPRGVYELSNTERYELPTRQTSWTSRNSLLPEWRSDGEGPQGERQGVAVTLMERLRIRSR